MNRNRWLLLAGLAVLLVGGILVVYYLFNRPMSQPIPTTALEEVSTNCGNTGTMRMLVIGLTLPTDVEVLGADAIRLVTLDFDQPSATIMSMPARLWVKTPTLLDQGVEESELAAVSQSIVIDAAETTVGAAINTQGARTITMIVTPSRTIAAAATELFRLVVQECDTEGGTYTAVDQTKILPIRNYDASGQILFNATSPYTMTFGVVDTKEWIKVGVVCAPYNTACTFAFNVVMSAKESPFLLYDPSVTSDGLP